MVINLNKKQIKSLVCINNVGTTLKIGSYYKGIFIKELNRYVLFNENNFYFKERFKELTNKEKIINILKK